MIKKGFTLIEMLVVISLIGILAALSLLSFTSVQKQARNTVRKSDLKQYQNALEAYANLSSGLFPSRTTVTSASVALCNDLNSVLEPDITCSEDPKSIPVYRYISDGTCTAGTACATKYVLWANLENKTVTTYWVVCSNGKNGESTTAPTSGTCPI